MNSKPKSIDMGSLIQKVTKRARELLKKKSKPQNKGKSANGTSRYSKSKRQKLLIGGVRVNIEASREDITNILSGKTDVNKEGKAHLVHLLKLQTIKKINEIYKELLGKMSRTDPTQEQLNHETNIKKILDIIEAKLNVSNLEELSADTNHVPSLDNTYEYEIFENNFDIYKTYSLEKDIIALNIFKMFKLLLDVENSDEFNPDIFNGGKINGGALDDVLNGKTNPEKLIIMTDRVDKYTKLITDVRANFVALNIMEPKIKKGDSLGTVTTNAGAIDDLLKDNFNSIITEESERTKFNKLLNDIRNGGKFYSIDVKESSKKSSFLSNKLVAYKWPPDGTESPTPLYIYSIAYDLQSNKYELTTVLKENSEGKKTSSDYSDITKNIKIIEKKLNELISKYQGITDGRAVIDNTFNNLYIEITTLIQDIKEKYAYLSQKHPQYKPEAVLSTGPQVVADELKGGGNPVKYKSTGQVVHIMFQNKKYKRVIYVKDKRNTKYCKMNNEYILLSKLKVIE